ncbi:MAG: nicotinate-nucleotide adenylyltransferase [Verrucomicrobiota bacterium]
MKIGLLGGSFDPVHNGHLALARAALAAGMERVWLIPAAQAPLKPAAVCAPAADRLAMLRLAAADCPGAEVCDIELRRGGINYTIDTVRALRAAHPDAELFWIIGADQLGRLDAWREIGALTELVEFLCAVRPGYALAAPAGLPGLRWRRLECPTWDVSLTEVRARLARGESPAGLVPDKAIEYLERTRLYR